MTQLVLSCLQDASSQNPVAIRQAEERLKQFETEPGFYTALLQVFSDKTQVYKNIIISIINIYTYYYYYNYLFQIPTTISFRIMSDCLRMMHLFNLRLLIFLMF